MHRHRVPDDWDTTRTHPRRLQRMETELYIDEFTNKGSGWVFREFKSAQVKIMKFQTIRNKFIELPKCIVSKSAVVNIRNNENKYFLWCNLPTLHPFGRGENRSIPVV